MIKVKKLTLCEDDSKYGSCLGCGKESIYDPEMVRVVLIHTAGMYTNGGSLCLCGKCRKLLAKGLTEGELYIQSPKRCGSCEYLDHSAIYSSNPPQYKCERYGCIVEVDAICRREKA